MKKCIKNSFLVSVSSRSELWKELHKKKKKKQLTVLCHRATLWPPTIPWHPLVAGGASPIPHSLRLRTTYLLESSVVATNVDIFKFKTKLYWSYNLLRYNLHTTSVTHCEYTHQLILTCVYSCVSTTTINCGNHLSTSSNGSLELLSINLLHSPAPGNHRLSDFLYITLHFLEFYMYYSVTSSFTQCNDFEINPFCYLY